MLRAGHAARGLLMVLAALALLALVSGALWPPRSHTTWHDGPLTCRVFRSDFTHEVVVKGAVESTENVEVRCDVSISGFYHTKILELVPEGTYVQPGDFLVRLDTGPLERMRVAQQIECYTSQAYVTYAEKLYETAVMSRMQYLEGTYRQQKLTLDSALTVAKEKHRRAAEYCQQSRRLYNSGYISDHELEANEFAAQKSQIELDLATTKVNVLENYTRSRMEMELECNVLTARARLESARIRHERNLEHLAELDSQIDNCLITAPSSGQVVYAHMHHYGHSHLIQEGESVFRRQVLIRLPDPQRMQVKATVREDRVALVAAGMPVRVRLEAYPGRELTGRVRRVSEYPNPVNWFGSSIKEFEVILALDETTLDLRPGLSAEAKVCVKEIPGQLLLPAQAVLSHDGKQYCLTCDAGRWQAHEVKTGSSDGHHVVICDGLEEGSRVVLGGNAYRDKVGLAEAESDRES